MKNKLLFFTLQMLCFYTFAQSGSIDPTFNSGTGTNNFVNSVAIQANGKILFGGSFSAYNQTPISGFGRLNADGSLDTTFNPTLTFVNNGSTYSNIRKIVIQSDGKILVGGTFTLVNGIATNGIVRLNVDGTLDNSFSLNPGALAEYNDVLDIAVQNDGKIIIAGRFTFCKGVSRNGIARLNSDGSLDASFDPGLGANPIWALALQSDGKILIGGSFTTVNNISRNRIARLNSNGSLDTSFNPGTGANNTIYELTLQSTGKILVGGWFTSYSGTNCNYFIRLNTNGSLDTTFNTGTSASSWVFSTLLQSDGKILIGGYFQNYNGISRKGIARLSSEGVLDITFNPGTGVESGGVNSIAMQNDGKILIGGDISGYNGNLALPQGIARLINDASLLSNQFDAEDGLKVYPNPANDHITIDYSNLANVSGWTIKIVNTLGQEVFSGAMNTQQYVVPLNSWSGQGVYFVKIYDASNNLMNTKKIILQ